jgi:hypothetical protein
MDHAASLLLSMQPQIYMPILQKQLASILEGQLKRTAVPKIVFSSDGGSAETKKASSFSFRLTKGPC